MKTCFFFIGCFFTLSVYLFGVEEYLNLLQNYPATLGPLGNYKQGEIEIVTDKNAIRQAKEVTGREVGIMAQDRYWLWINDPVRFPNGKYGVYGRLLWRQSLVGDAGVVIVAYNSQGKILLLKNFRHATRCWEYELPRGCLMEGESTKAAAKRELIEETGFVPDELIYLGQINTDSGMTNTRASIFLAKIQEKRKATPEDAEAISGLHFFSIHELKKGLLNGSISRNGEAISLKDPFLSFALLHMLFSSPK